MSDADRGPGSADREAIFTDAEIGRVIVSADLVIQETRRMLEAWEFGDAARWVPDAATESPVFDWYELDADAGVTLRDVQIARFIPDLYLNGGRIRSCHFWIGEHGPEVIADD